MLKTLDPFHFLLHSFQADPVSGYYEVVAGELESGFSGHLRVRMAFRDEALGGPLRLLEDEARSGEPPNGLYIDHLAYALTLTLRLFSLGKRRRESHLPKGGLPLHILRRVIERMNATLSTDLDHKTLAAEERLQQKSLPADVPGRYGMHAPSILLTASYRESPVDDEESIPAIDRYWRVLWLRQPDPVFPCISTDPRNNPKSVSSRHFVRPSVKAGSFNRD
jgi:hypothetical protein